VRGWPSSAEHFDEIALDSSRPDAWVGAMIEPS
jgi:hypothetical protein